MPPDNRLSDEEIVQVLKDAEKVVSDAEIDADLWPVAFARVLDYKFTNLHFDAQNRTAQVDG